MDIILKEEKKVNFNKSGSGSTSAKIVLPKKFVESLNIAKEKPNITISLTTDRKIIIEKL